MIGFRSLFPVIVLSYEHNNSYHKCYPENEITSSRFNRFLVKLHLLIIRKFFGREGTGLRVRVYSCTASAAARSPAHHTEPPPSCNTDGVLKYTTKLSKKKKNAFSCALRF